LNTSEKTYSETPAARRKRKYREDPAVRKAERLRQNAAYAAKKGTSAHKKKLAAKRSARKQNLLKVNEKQTAMTPFAAPDECEGVYVLEKRTEVTIKEIYKHSYRKTKPTECAQGLGKKLVNIEFDNNNKPKARTISQL